MEQASAHHSFLTKRRDGIMVARACDAGKVFGIEFPEVGDTIRDCVLKVPIGSDGNAYVENF